jgi:hypothetical protein
LSGCSFGWQRSALYVVSSLRNRHRHP